MPVKTAAIVKDRNVGRWMISFSFGVVVGVVGFALLRVAWVAYRGHPSIMSPYFGVMFSPLIALMLLFLVAPLEYVLREQWFGPRRWSESLLFGVGASTLLSAWAFPPYWQIVLLCNPLTVRFLVRRVMANYASMDSSLTSS